MSNEIVIETTSFLVSKETFLAIKQHQKEITSYAQKRAKQWRAYIQARRQWGKTVGNKLISNEFLSEYNGVQFNFSSTFNKKYLRAFNVFYGLIKGKKYSQIEQKVKENNSIDWSYLSSFCTHFKVDYVSIKELIHG